MTDKPVYGSLITASKCYGCIHFPLCMAQKGGVNLGLASENDCMYFQPKLPENAVILTKEEYSDYLIFQRNHEFIREKAKNLQEDNERLYKNIGKFKDIVRKQTARDFVKDLLQELDLVGYDKSDFCVTAVKLVAKQYGVEVEE